MSAPLTEDHTIMATNVDASRSTFNTVGRDQYNTSYNAHYTFLQEGLSKPPSSLSFNDAPLDLLSVHFTGREQELSDIGNILDSDVAHDDTPTRCVIFGMYGLGKSQLLLQFAKSAFNRGRYSLVFWISATTIEKLNQGFVNILHLVGHSDRFHQEQSARLISARRWLEESGPIDWLLVFDNVGRSTLGFLREHLPHKNRRGNILFTTRTEIVAQSLAQVAGRQHELLELRQLDAKDAAKLLLQHFEKNGINQLSSKAEDVARCVGCLPLAVAHAAAFMKQSGKSLDDMLALYQSERKIDVSSVPGRYCFCNLIVLRFIGN